MCWPELSKTRVGYYALASDGAREVVRSYLNGRSGSWLFPSRKGGPTEYGAFRLHGLDC